MLLPLVCRPLKHHMCALPAHQSRSDQRISQMPSPSMSAQDGPGIWSLVAYPM
jgi:hypothetical protein